MPGGHAIMIKSNIRIQVTTKYNAFYACSNADLVNQWGSLYSLIIAIEARNE